VTFTLIAGPCTVESREQTLTTARCVAAGGATMLRGGAFKPRTSPHSFQGLGRAALAILAEARAETGLPVVTELTDVRELDAVLDVADVIQVGARNMQNAALLTEIGRSGRPVLIKRGPAATLDELLHAADYVLAEGNMAVTLCERGIPAPPAHLSMIRTFERSTRYTLDLSAVPVLKERTDLAVIVDPSHAAGRRELVRPLSLAAVAAGADGLIVEVHPDPAVALCDGPQALTTAEFADYAAETQAIARAVRPVQLAAA
jgi:3-deoxy-7-phosphoheptulonate synthase